MGDESELAPFDRALADPAEAAGEAAADAEADAVVAAGEGAAGVEP